MAQGCILPFTREDSEQLRRSLREPLAQASYQAAARAYLADSVRGYRSAVTYPLSDPTHPAHRLFAETVLRNVFGNESIAEAYKFALPKALAVVARQTADVVGLVVPARGPGATALDRNLANKRVGNGFAYELLGTAELIRRNSVHESGSTPINGGKALRIYETDRIDLGVRFQAGYGAAGAKQGLYRPASPRSPGRSRATFEADLLIQRNDGFGSWHSIGVDFKHAKDGMSYTYDVSNSQSQLRAVANGILTGDMGLKGFHFVTNGSFRPEFRRAVDKINEEIMAKSDSITSPPIGLHEKVQFPLT